MGYRVAKFRSDTGESMCLLERDDGWVHLAATQFGTSEIRNKGKSLESEHKHLIAIALLLEFCEANEVDLIGRIRSKECFTLSEINKITDELSKSRDRLSTVSPYEHGMRISYVTKFLSYLFDEINDVETRHRNGTELKAVINRFLKRKVKINKHNLVEAKGLSDGQIEEARHILNPSSERNPFKTKFQKLRNELIFDILLETGMRSGELLGLRLEDFVPGKKELAIRRRHDSADDPRARQPNQKTRERDIFLSADMVNRIQDYIRERALALPSYKNNHDFLIVASDGKPLAQNSLNYIFDRIREKSKILENLYPHALRHTWNRKFSEHCDRNNVKPERELKLRNHMMGWSQKSKMAGTYNMRHIIQEAREVTIQIGEDLAMIGRAK